jgi:hypothetical protein
MWRPVCSVHVAFIERHAAPTDRLRIRRIETGTADEAHRKRALRLAGHGRDE